MAEFKDVCRQWCRMCHEQYGGCGEGCPMGENDVCGFTRRATNADIEQAERIIMDWAKANPEPVYPTWVEWLQEMGVMTDINDRLNNYKQVMEVCGKPLYSIPTAKVLCPIPADIAEKLGIEPKEG